jgi:hypothetical protein
MVAFLAASLPEGYLSGAVHKHDGATQQADALIKAGVGFVVYPQTQRYNDLGHEGAAQYVAEKLAADAYPHGLPGPVRPSVDEVLDRAARTREQEIGTPNLAPGERVPAHGLEYRPDLLERDKIRQQGTGRRDDLEGWTSDLRG